MKVQSTRIKSNDFPEEDRQLVETLGRTLNPLIDRLVLAFNKNITVDDNLPFEFKNLDVEVDGTGTPISGSAVKTSLTNFKGYICLNVLDINNTGIYPTTAPFVLTELTGNIINIRKITGLPSGAVYRLVLLGIS